MSIYVDVVFAIDEVSEQHQLCLAPRVVFEKSAHSYTRTKDGNICKDIAHLWAEAYRDLNEDERSTWEGHLSSGGDCPALIPQCFPDVVSISNCGFSEGVPRLNDDEHNAATKAALIHDTIVNSPISLYSMMAGPLCQAQEVVFLRPSQDMVVDCFVQALRDIEDRWRRLRQVFLGRLTAYEEQPPTRCEPEPLAIAPSPPRPSVQLPDAKTYASPYIDDTGHLQDEPPSSGQGQYSMAYEDIQRAVRVPRLQGSAARKKEGLHAPLHRPATPTLSEKSPPLRALSAGRRRSSQPLLDAADLSMESAHVGSAYTPRSVGRSSSSPMSITAEFEVSLASIERFPVAASRPPPRRTIVRAKGIDAHFSIPQTVAPSSMAADTCPLELHTSPISIEASDVEELPTVDTTEAAVHTSLSHISTLTPATDVVSLQHSPPPSSLAGSVPVTALVQPGGKQPLGQTRSPSSRLPPRSPVRTTPPAPSLTPQPQQQQQEEEGAVGVRVATAAARGEAPESSHSQERSPTVPPSSAIPQLRRAAMTPSWSGSAHSEENLNEREEEDLQRTFRRTLPPISVHAAGSAPACTAPSPLAPAYLPQFSPSPSTSRPAHSPSSESSCSNSNSCSHSGSSTTQSSSGRGREATETSITGSQSPVEPCPESHQSVGSDSLHREHIYSAPLPKEIEIALKSFPAGQAMQEEGPCQLRERFSPEPQRPLASIVSSVTSATLEVDIPPPSHSHWQSSVHSSYHHANSSHHSVTQRPASSHSASRLSVPEGTWHVPVHDHSGVSGDNGQLVHYPTQMPGGSLTFSSSGHKSNDSENAPRRKVVLVSRLVRRRKVRDTTSGASAGNRSRSASAGRSGSESTRGDGKRYTKKAPAAHDTHESRRAVK